MENINQVWPKWQVEEILGEGGFGRVYKAKRETFGGVEYSAIKVVKIPSNPSEVVEMSTSGFTDKNIKDYYYKSVLGMVDEIKLMGKLKSASHIVSIEDYEVIENKDNIGWTIYIRMELLTNMIKHFKDVPITVDEVVKMATHILTALEFCHDENIIHRDIKPGNIFISSFGEYKLGDFGVSREAEKSMATMSQKGTKSYMAPEMVRMEKYGKNVDLYALGLTMYELLNHGRMPFLPPFPESFFPQDREEAIIKRLSGEVFPEIEGIGSLNQIIQKACHASPNERYQSATEMKEALLQLNLGSKKEEVIFEEEKTQVGSFGLFDDKSQKGMQELFTEKENSFVNQEEGTIGIFSNGFLFKDEKSEAFILDKEKDDVYEIKCPHCGSRAKRVFSKGYHCNKEGCYRVSITSQDEIAKKRRDTYVASLREKDLNRELQLTLELERLDPQSEEVELRVADTYRKLNQPDKQYQHLQKALELNEENAYCHLRLGLYYLDKKQYQKAYDHGIKAIHLDNIGKSSINNSYWLYINQAIYAQKVGKPKEAFNYAKLAYIKNANRKELSERVEGWKIGYEFTEEMVRKAFEELGYDSKICRKDAVSIKTANAQFTPAKNTQTLYALGPSKHRVFKGIWEIEKYNLIFTSKDINYRDEQGKTWFLNYYTFNQVQFECINEHLQITVGGTTYKVHLGENAQMIIPILTRITNEIKMKNTQYTIKCPHCGSTAYLVFTNGYHCNKEGCYKITLKDTSEKTKNIRDAYVALLNETNDANKFTNALTLSKLDPDSAHSHIRVAARYAKMNNKEKYDEHQKMRLNHLMKAYALDHEDANVLNQLGVYYYDHKDYKKALEYSSRAIESYENAKSSLIQGTYVYANHGIYLEKNGRSKEAYYYAYKAWDKGHPLTELADTLNSFNIGHDYCVQVVNEIIKKYKSKLSANAKFNFLDGAKEELRIHKNADVLLAIKYNGQTTMAITSRGFEYYSLENKHGYINFYVFSSQTFTVNGHKIISKNSSNTRTIEVGTDAKIICEILQELKKRFTY